MLSHELYDFRIFKNHLSTTFQECLESNNKIAVLVIGVNDLNKLYRVFDTSTYTTLITEITNRLKQSLRTSDIVLRINKDEIGVILPAVMNESHVVLAAHKILRTLTKPYHINEKVINLKVAIGITISPFYDETGFDNIIQQAHIALNESIATQSEYCIYELEHNKKNQSEFAIEDELRNAIYHNELLLYYQPQLDLQTGKINSVESLLRWNNNNTFISPELFIKTAEYSGLVDSLTHWVINTAMRSCNEFSKSGLDLTVGINLSVHNLKDKDFPLFVEQALSTWQVDPKKIVLEVTESTMMDNSQDFVSILNQLKDLGVTLSIDDFGTGYSSLAYLKQLPFDELKVDKSFVMNMLKSKDDEQIVKTIIELAHNFDLKIVAEGVEDEKTLEILKELGCHKIQGFLISPALPDEEFRNFLQ